MSGSMLTLIARRMPFLWLRWWPCSRAALTSCGGGASSGGGYITASRARHHYHVASQRRRWATAYSTTLAATGGSSPYTWSLTAGILPPGLSLDTTTGMISGTPVGGANGATLTVRVADAATPAHTATATLTITVLIEDLRITSNALPVGHVNTPYDATLTAAGGTAPYSWTLTGGTLPAGLALNSASGEITGTPTSAASAALTFQVTDSATPPATQSVALALTITTAPLTITTTALPFGQIGVTYNAQLSATGGSGAFSWQLTAGSLPSGLQLNSTTGVISGMPTATAIQTPVTFSVTDSSAPPQTQSAAFTVTVSPAGISVEISPQRAGLTITQQQTLTATTNDNAGVSWSASPAAGAFSPTASASGTPVTFTAPTSAGVYTLTATSVTDGTRSASITVGVTDLAGVYTYHNDVARDGANAQEYALTPANVNAATFGKLFSCAVDGAVYAQPLWVANLSISGVSHNVILVATAHDSVYAFDADASPCQTLWHANLIDPTHRGKQPARTRGSGRRHRLSGGMGYGDMAPEVGVTGTPVIDPAAKILYVVSKSVDATGTVFYQRLHAIDLTERQRARPVRRQPSVGLTMLDNGGTELRSRAASRTSAPVSP